MPTTFFNLIDPGKQNSFGSISKLAARGGSTISVDLVLSALQLKPAVSAAIFVTLKVISFEPGEE